MSRYIPDSLRKMVAEQAQFCCEYCLMKEVDAFYSFEDDHIISLKHGGETILGNLARSCFPCNNNKGSDVGTVLLPNLRFVRLFNPREDIWNDHFEMDDSVIYAKTEVEEATVKVLKFNEIERIIERRVIAGLQD